MRRGLYGTQQSKVLTPLYISLWGAKKNHPSYFGGKRERRKGHNNILDHFSYLQAPLGLFICFVSFLKLDFDYFLVYYNVNEEQNYLITGEGKRERESGR